MTKKSKAKGAIKLPKSIMGMKLPKKARRSVNKLFRSAHSSKADLFVTALAGALATKLAEHMNEPLERALKKSGLVSPPEGKAGAPAARH
ncbi:MAG TPA: hypothetical protein VJM34_07960 [Novosphingobium sp.]|nr:hypothetical protein [Novosphingobium sp.]